MSVILDLDPSTLRQGAHHTRSDVSVCVIHDLVKSFKAHGQIVPIDVIRSADGGWSIWDGCRRALAAAGLGQPVRAREMEPFASEDEARIAYYAANYNRRNAGPSAIILKDIHHRLATYTGRRRRALRWLAYDFGITQKKLERLGDLWAQLLAKDPRMADRAVVERWSVHEVGVALGMPTHTERKKRRLLEN